LKLKQIKDCPIRFHGVSKLFDLEAAFVVVSMVIDRFCVDLVRTQCLLANISGAETGEL
jgi:hypothetical protein